MPIFTKNRWRRVTDTMEYPLDMIQEQCAAFKNRTDDELKEIIRSIRHNNGSAAPDIQNKYAVFAAVKEAVRRVLMLELHDVQLLAGWQLADGCITEMATGEGKTVTAALPAVWYALRNRGIHVMTVNEYLAQRDFEQLSGVFGLLGLSVGLNSSGMLPADKRRAYRQDITYGVFKEFGFDYLRDHLVVEPRKRVQRPLAYAIVDEADSILIDEAKTPLIIADKISFADDLYTRSASIVERLQPGIDYEFDAETRQVSLTDLGIQSIQSTLDVENLYSPEYTDTLHALTQSLRARAVMRRDVDYIVDDGAMKIIDSFTGRTLEGRQFNGGLHQAIEAKERLPLSPDNRICGEITIQKYFSLYERSVGMTGTIVTDEEEIRSIYGLEVVGIPTAKPLIRHDEPDLIFLTKSDKYDGILREIEACYSRGQPVLVGTTTIEQSEDIAGRLGVRGLPYQLLTAKHEREESDIIARAGQKGAITVATNMAGRGTDIRLGEGAAELGGLCVIGTERHECSRIDNQLRGRAGRQGDPGRSRFFLSLEDELLVRFADQDEVDSLRRHWSQERCGTDDAELRRFIERVQKTAESRMMNIRSIVSRLDSVIHEQRQAVYAHRNELWQAGAFRWFLHSHVREYIAECVDRACPDGFLDAESDIADLFKELGTPLADPQLMHSRSDSDDLLEALLLRWNDLWKAALSLPGIRSWLAPWRKRYATMLDRVWMEHLDHLQEVKQGIHFRVYGQEDPDQAFQLEALQLYIGMKQELTMRVGRWMLTKALPNMQSTTRRRLDGQCPAN